MKLPEFKGFLEKVRPKETVGEKKTVKQIVDIKMPGRTYDDGWGNSKTSEPEIIELAVLNGKIEESFLKSLVGKKVVVEQSFLNSYEYEQEVDPSHKEKRHALSAT